MGFNRFFFATTYYWDRGEYIWLYILFLISLLVLGYRLGTWKSIVLHLIMVPLIFNRIYWLTDASWRGERHPDSIMLAIFTLAASIVIYIVCAIGLGTNDR